MVKKYTICFSFILLSVYELQSQFIVGAKKIDNAAQFEVKSSNKGVLLPRVELTGTNDITSIANLSIGKKESLLVYNLASRSDVKPGYYYWNKNKWVALKNTDNQHLTLSGENLIIDRGNTISLSGFKDNLGNHFASQTLNLNQNKLSNVDHIEFKKAGGDFFREGYIGYNNSNMQYVSEQGKHLFKGGKVNISNLPEVSGSTFAMVTEMDGTLRKQSWERIVDWISSQVSNPSDGDAWGVNGENQLGNITRSGNVGVGISPEYKFHVKGRTKLDGLHAGTWIESGEKDWFIGRNGADLRFYNTGDKVVMKPNGHVGIGTSSPESKLTVEGGNVRVKADQPGVFLDRNGSVVWRIYVNQGNNGLDANDLVLRKQGVGTHYMVVNDKTGNFAFGGAKSQGHKIRAYGSVRATKFVSDAKSYPDYVFDHYYDGISEINKEYKFPTLEEVEDFTKKNHHLPGVSSYDEIINGIDVSRLSVQNLEKIEEMYLHIIALNKEVKKITKEKEELYGKFSSELSLMQKRVEKLTIQVRQGQKTKQ